MASQSNCKSYLQFLKMSSLKKYSLKKVIYYKFIVTNYENFNFLKIPYENKIFLF